jgi:hypothetical protein
MARKHRLFFAFVTKARDGSFPVCIVPAPYPYHGNRDGFVFYIVNDSVITDADAIESFYAVQCFDVMRAGIVGKVELNSVASDREPRPIDVASEPNASVRQPRQPDNRV